MRRGRGCGRAGGDGEGVHPGPFLVITELSLPLVDGYALCEILRADRTTSDVPILVVTAEDAPEARLRARSAGADAVLTKPASREAILREMRRLTAHGRELRRRSAATSAVVAEQLRRSADLIARSEKNRRRIPAKAIPAAATASARPTPLALLCPSCSRPLTFVASTAADQLRDRRNRFTCSNGCGVFEYRCRSKEITRVG